MAGFAAGVLGFAVGFTPVGANLEEDLGLGILFRLRGHRAPPSEVLVVSIDKESADRFDLEDNYRKWPRFLHARLTETLAERGAKVIAFDVFFEDEGDPVQDSAFSEAVKKAGNVLLCERLQSEKIPLTGGRGHPAAEVAVSRKFPPTPLLAASAASCAPYPLPKLPVKVSRDWTFKTLTGNTCFPTLPVIAFQWYALQAYEDLHRLLERVFPGQAAALPRSGTEFLRTYGIRGMTLELKEFFDRNPSAKKELLSALDRSPLDPGDRKTRRILRSLIRLYADGDRKILNFYGPVRTIPTIPYHRALGAGKDGEDESAAPDVRGKVVFVGSSESRQLAQKDGFNTIYTNEEGVDLSGVEIQATSFANLVEDMSIRPLPAKLRSAVILLWGVAVGILSFRFRPAVSMPAVAALSLLYLGAAVHRFASEAEWCPVVVPLMLQAPLLIAGAVGWNYLELGRERRNFRKAFSFYLPTAVVDDLARDFEESRVSSRLVNGVCLSTDAEHYTTLSESMGPEELARSLNRYYETVFEPVRRNGGVVSNVIADSMMALWVTTGGDPEPLKKACLAAVEISEAMRELRRAHDAIRIPTRIGLHSGEILLGNIGASEHFEYRPVGDIVNTASRIEGLNKYLGTRVLVSKEVISPLDMFLVRDVGKFLLAGKTRPVHLFELVTLLDKAEFRQKKYCASFTEGMERFRRQDWADAAECFKRTLEIRAGDGPSLFYQDLCVRYSLNPPEMPWEGVVPIGKK